MLRWYRENHNGKFKRVPVSVNYRWVFLASCEKLSNNADLFQVPDILSTRYVILKKESCNKWHPYFWETKLTEVSPIFIDSFRGR